MTGLEQAQAAMKDVRTLIERHGGVIRELGPRMQADGSYALRVRIVNPLKHPLPYGPHFGNISLLIETDYDLPIDAVPRRNQTDEELRQSRKFSFQKNR